MTDTTTTAGPTGRVGALLNAIRTEGGEWTTKRVLRLYKQAGLGPRDARIAHMRQVARGDLRDLAVWGWLLRHGHDSDLHYTLNTRKDGNQ